LDVIRKEGESGKTEVKEMEEGKKEGKPQPAEEFITNSIGMKFKFILGGSFLMGSPDFEKDRNNDEGPQHQVTLTKPYYLGVYEVTQEQYEKVMGLNPSQYKDAKSPVENVSWDDAQEFCRKLSELEKNTIYRLPTEAEWEYACRAGTTTAYYWGDSFDPQYAWTKENHDGTTQEIGTRQANPWGLFDMSGNVWEWCGDWYSADYSEVREQVDPTGADAGLYRVIRGGSWYSDPQYCRSAFRLNPAPDFRISYLGFRVLAVPAVGRGGFNPEFVEKQVQKETVPQQEFQHMNLSGNPILQVQIRQIQVLFLTLLV
jgi:formylglycine-generating enzyme required for sulfatase activity